MRPRTDSIGTRCLFGGGMLEVAVRFALLGPLSVHDGDGPVQLRGTLRRTLLAALLLDAGNPVSADRLAELLWGPDSPGAVSAPLHNQITRLRHALGDEARVRAVPPGYLIPVQPGELDLHVFAEECAAGHRALTELAWSEASARFNAALGLWRGNPLADVPALAEDPRLRELEEAHVRALQGRIEAELNLGRHHELIDELSGLIPEHPRNESFRRQLMLALHRTGRSDEAVAAYDAYQYALLDELGLEPGGDLRELRDAIARRDRALTLPQNPNAPRQLPAGTRLFTGRDEQLGRLLEAAGQSSGTLVISALDGLGGIGKTALAVHAAHHVSARFPDGQLFIDLRGHAAADSAMPVEEALAYLLRSLGVEASAMPDGAAERAALYRTKLENSRTLIVLDNAAAEEQLRPLLPGASGCLVLVTSRHRLAGLDGARALTLDVLGEQESVALLAKVAGPRCALGDTPEVRELARLCGHLPLALRIVAARLRHHDSLTVESLIAELGDDSGRLGGLSDGERDLRSVFDSSFTALSAPERNLLRLLGLAFGPDTDAYAAANLADVDLATAERLLDSLVDRNLLIQQRVGRYTLHDLVRSYVRTLTDRDGDESSAALERLSAYYQHTAWAAAVHVGTGMRWRAQSFPEPSGPTPEPRDLTDSLTWYRAEWGNLLAAATDAAAVPDRRIDLTAGMAGYLLHDGPYSTAARLHDAAARDAEALGETLAKANALCNLSQIMRMIGHNRLESSRELAEQALEIYRALGHRRGESDALFRLAQIWYVLGKPADAKATHLSALLLAVEVGDRRSEAVIRHSISQACELLRETDEARTQIRMAAELYREVGPPIQESLALSTIASLEIEQGELEAAMASSRASIAKAREYGHRQIEAGAHTLLARVLSARGEHDAAHTEFRTALELFEEIGYGHGEAIVLSFLGPDRTAAGDLDAALEYLERGHAEFAEDASLTYSDVEILRELGYARHLSGDANGTALVERMLDLCRGRLKNTRGQAMALIRLGQIGLDRAEPAAALDRYLEALPITREPGMALDLARALDGLSRCHLRLGDPEAALEPLREAVSMYRRMGLAELAAAEERLAVLNVTGPGTRRPRD